MTRKRSVFIVLIVLLIITTVLSACMGAYSISLTQIGSIISYKLGIGDIQGFTQGQMNVFWFIRFPRIVLSVLIGAALAVSGAGMQGVFRNPLADPGLIGISAGAILAAAISILFGIHFIEGIYGLYALSFCTFLGACTSAWLVFQLARSGSATQMTTLLLAGIAINALCGALTGLMIYLSDNDELRDITFWTLGSLGGANWKSVLVLLPLVGIPLYLIPRLARKLDVFALGEADAFSLGINVQQLKTQLVLLVTLAVGASVALVGMIGFIGLVVPHIVRLLLGSSHKTLFWGAALGGALLLTLADLICRTIVSPAELPIGILTAIMGTPLFISLLMKQKKKGMVV